MYSISDLSLHSIRRHRKLRRGYKQGRTPIFEAVQINASTLWWGEDVCHEKRKALNIYSMNYIAQVVHPKVVAMGRMIRIYRLHAEFKQRNEIPQRKVIVTLISRYSITSDTQVPPYYG
ncbi:predicted protein [Sclerotinia sclerotiorum 1980 UF-70]|uniref:Uncharacterized protein n=1 Tax=Sclerotinia sclerotiorum (strain ATCC 18683 / 1980 / Ss-1) TaxID=665079 RepID=A7ETB7_SCLS1|nr:predicted protein [Sclerotinia sclerotiorum 1980 UF-70]EDN92709.1 predicted protein [Sclerotinia sclerotiorum 1980 UF-70]